MNIEYNKIGSKFIEPCKTTIKAEKIKFLAKQKIEVNLGGSGYNAVVVIDIKDNPLIFDTNWIGSDSSRFPARIKACATSLFELNYKGKYEVSHFNGVLTITSL